ncbi:MAG TPA: response regulator transcription factor [Chthoniobacteraceae bacterium]|nr:response regulator transcription factor [Chthoniobacteraceae bacterium]
MSNTSNSGQKTRVLLADDHMVMRRGLRAIIETMEGWEVCAEVESGREAVQAVERLRPEIAVLDMTMPELNGLEATRQIKKIAPETEVLIFTGHETEELVHQVFEAGARSYILKTDGKAQLEAALRSLAEHKPYFTTQIGEILFSKLLNKKKGIANDESATVGRLTDREREIVQLLVEGKSNKEVADVLGISVKTTETHRAAIMRKLQLKAFSELVRYAIRNHIISA